MWKEHKGVILTTVVLIALYLVLFVPSTRGYGYLGHDGYDEDPSFLYWGGTGHYYPSRSVRTGSAGGTGVRGGGMAEGK
jgi:hypothetical protein